MTSSGGRTVAVPRQSAATASICWRKSASSAPALRIVGHPVSPRSARRAAPAAWSWSTQLRIVMRWYSGVLTMLPIRLRVR